VDFDASEKSGWLTVQLNHFFQAYGGLFYRIYGEGLLLEIIHVML
jgi:hypothetical protein